MSFFKPCAIGTDRRRAKHFGPLEIARRVFEHEAGIGIDWDEDLPAAEESIKDESVSEDEDLPF